MCVWGRGCFFFFFSFVLPVTERALLKIPNDDGVIYVSFWLNFCCMYSRPCYQMHINFRLLYLPSEQTSLQKDAINVLYYKTSFSSGLVVLLASKPELYDKWLHLLFFDLLCQQIDCSIL